MNTSCTESIKAVQYKLTLFLTRVTRPNHLTDRNTLHLYTSSFTMAAYNICQKMSTSNGWKVHSILSFSCWLGWKHQLSFSLFSTFRVFYSFDRARETMKFWWEIYPNSTNPILRSTNPYLKSTDLNSSLAPPNEPLSHCLHSDGTMSTPYSTIDWAHPQDLGNGSRAGKKSILWHQFIQLSIDNAPRRARRKRKKKTSPGKTLTGNKTAVSCQQLL